MITMDVKFNNQISKMTQRLIKKFDALPKEAYQEFVKNTPVRTGNARRSTKLRNGIIEADYQYAEVLDKGRHMTTRGARGSDQAPRGMTKPTEEFVKKRTQQILQGK
jgi:hypothetical protein